MKTILLVIALSLVLVFGVLIHVMSAHNEYSREAGSYWDLATKAATIEQKSEYVTKFAQQFRDKGYEGQHNALFFPSPNNSFDENYKALLSLEDRLAEIQMMDPQSIQYQSAIQQITEQEQDGAYEMIGELRGIWFMNNHYMCWLFWPFFILFIIGLIGLIVSVTALTTYDPRMYS